MYLLFTKLSWEFYKSLKDRKNSCVHSERFRPTADVDRDQLSLFHLFSLLSCMEIIFSKLSYSFFSLFFSSHRFLLLSTLCGDCQCRSSLSSYRNFCWLLALTKIHIFHVNFHQATTTTRRVKNECSCV